MNKLGDDELGLILSLVADPDDRKSASEVCKGWWIMEGLSRSSLLVDDPDHLPRLLARYPNLTTFETHNQMSNADLALVAQSCPKLSTIVLGRNGDALLGITALITSAAHNLTHLDMDGCWFVTDQAFEAIGSSSCALRFLSLRGSSVTDDGLRFLTNGSCSKTIKQLKLESCCHITDVGVSLLCMMRVLEELDLAFCAQLTDVGGQAISTIQTLKVLNLACLIDLTEQTFVALAKNCINLEVLILQECEVTATSIHAFLGHKCLRSLNLISCLSDDFKGSILESLALGCPSLESIVVQESWREKLLQEMQKSTVSRFLHFSHF
ncbi:PREDICTED: F-box/LRR-repeat protein 2-like [Fragaria vesca subsp. vesca]|uniref:F-box/LRR-repeat protein 2-like n=1 Tax=Fragaria vesca subsp. vesca TaxID=101020 RepID=UPI0002C3511F|nr:PREDICTED: F-box/LRR-repeat protein 2-like [Fragaria vesca subsp. vesca]